MRQLINVLAVNFCSLKKNKRDGMFKNTVYIVQECIDPTSYKEREKTHSVNAIPKYESQTHYFLSFYGSHFVIYSVEYVARKQLSKLSLFIFAE